MSRSNDSSQHAKAHVRCKRTANSLSVPVMNSEPLRVHHVMLFNDFLCRILCDLCDTLQITKLFESFLAKKMPPN